MRKLAATFVTSTLLFAGLAGTASAQTQDGLVNIVIGDVTILEDVNVAVAANLVAAICVQDVNVVLLGAIETDESGTAFVCRAGGGRGQQITITQN